MKLRNNAHYCYTFHNVIHTPYELTFFYHNKRADNSALSMKILFGIFLVQFRTAPVVVRIAFALVDAAEIDK